ncbi:CopG family transcriptional regulator [Salinigranum rubrum]|uniref:CopG family transcriptional regulator n=1 Tax=Salinigranum rubrum TaxID=755307 RepID=A0A2I8VL16_9EURY|nr:CopG family transcriptional regulator [Salinigranum rubrum]
MSGGERTSVELPNTLVSDIDGRIRGTAFESAGEYITFVLEEVLLELDEASEPNGETLDEDEVEERLQALGYLDK